MLPHFGIGRGITEANGQRIVAGMSRSEVEAILGPPNPLPASARMGKFFWDNYTVSGFHYVAVSVTYDAEGRVADSRVSGFWSKPRWLPR
jgi:hypothetical protein